MVYSLVLLHSSRDFLRQLFNYERTSESMSPVGLFPVGIAVPFT